MRDSDFEERMDKVEEAIEAIKAETWHPHTLTIRGDDTVKMVLELDGKPLQGVTEVSFKLTPCNLVEVTVKMYIDLDVSLAVHERIFRSPSPNAPMEIPGFGNTDGTDGVTEV